MGYINMKKLVALLSAGIVLISISGCKKKNSTQLNTSDNYSHPKETLYGETQQKNEIHTNTEIIDNKELELFNKSEKEIETEVVEYFEDLENEINYYVNQDNFDKVKERAKEIAIIGIDFIFYGTEIKGITFDELTQESKEKIMCIVSSIDGKLESKIPGYKETIKDKFGRGYDYLSEKLEKGLDFIDGKLDEKYGEDYENAKDKAKDVGEDIKNGASDLYDSAKEEFGDGWSKIKEWYENKTGK